MKSPLILGHDIPNQSPETLSVLSNADAIAINQDALGIQAQRVAVNASAAAALPLVAGRNVAVVAPCDARRPTQAWTRTAAGALRTTDAFGTEWCLAAPRPAEEGGWSAVECAASGAPLVAAADGRLLTADGALALSFNNDRTASGPLPHTRYVLGVPAADAAAGAPAWAEEPLARSAAKRVRLLARGPVAANDNVGGVADAAGEQCLDVTADGTTEVWAGPLTGGRWAVALFNRLTVSAQITAHWAAFNVSSSASFAVRDVWAAADKGSATGSYSATVPAQAVSYVVLTPA